MKYRPFGNTSEKISALGFGCMRFPMIQKDGSQVPDMQKSIDMVRSAIDRGVNYVDTAHGYCAGKSEETLGMALKDGYRDKVLLATKMPTFSVKKKSDYRRFLEEQLKRLDVDTIDFYHFHALSQKLWDEVVCKFDMMEDAYRAKEEGLIRHICFSFHDKPSVMRMLIDTGHFESVLCQYNMLDRSNEEMIEYAAQKGLGVVVMGPVAGGRLVAPSNVFQSVMGESSASTPELALRFVLANPNVSCALSGMSDQHMVDENVRVADNAAPLSEAEHERIQHALDEIKDLAKLYCTGCKYCMPCPQGISIPHLFDIMNYKRVYGLTEYAEKLYENVGKNERSGKRPVECTECGICETKCPQNIKIREQLKEIVREFGR